jgi:hypothetical protein
MGKTSKWYHSPHTTEEQLIKMAEAELIDREAELVDLRVEFFAFQLEYETRVGRRVTELEKVEAEIERCQQLVSSYRQRRPGGPFQTGGGQTYIPVEEQYRRTWQQPTVPSPPPSAEPMDAATEAQIKKLYRQLCRRFHPDLAQDAAERAWRTEMMMAVNAAYAARDLAKLQALAGEPDRSPETKTGMEGRRLVTLNDRLQQIQRRLREVEQEIRELTNSEMIQLSLEVKLARQQGWDLLAEIAADVDKDLAQKRVELDFVVAQLKQLGIEG